MACDDWMFGRFCSPFCNDQYDFAEDLSTSVWACGASGVWLPPVDWPDCAGNNHETRLCPTFFDFTYYSVCYTAQYGGCILMFGVCEVLSGFSTEKVSE